MRPLGFLVADKNMEACLKGLLAREAWHRSLGCAPVDLQPRDIHVAAGQNDPGLFKRADTLLAVFRAEYERIVVMIDAEWDGSPGAEAIAEQLSDHLRRAGWETNRSLPLVLEPEVDAWLWTPTDHTARALGWTDWSALQAALKADGLMVDDRQKPARPKEAAEWALRRQRMPRTSAVYSKVSQSVGLKHCNDAAFDLLRRTLQSWFPAAGSQA